MQNSKFCWTCHSISPNLVVEAFPKISIKKHFQCDMWSWLGWEEERANPTGAQSLFHRKPNLANCCQSEAGKPPSWARPASQFWASTLPHTLEKSHDQCSGTHSHKIKSLNLPGIHQGKVNSLQMYQVFAQVQEFSNQLCKGGRKYWFSSETRFFVQY